MMRTIDDYMSLNYRMEIVEDKEEGGFVVSYPELPGCITCGETMELPLQMLRTQRKPGCRLHWRKESRFMSQTVWKNILDSLS